MFMIPKTATISNQEKLQKFATLFAAALECLGKEYYDGTGRNGSKGKTFIAGFADAIELAFDEVDTLDQDDTFLLLDCIGDIQAALTTRQRQAVEWHLQHDMEHAMRDACKALVRQ